MMLTAVQTNPSPSVFSRVHNPDPPPSTMDTDCETSSLRLSPATAPVQTDQPDNSPSPPGHQAGTPQMIPIAMVPPPHIVIGPGGNYTLVPSLGSGRESVLGSLSSLQPLGQFTGGINGKTPLIPAAYYGAGGHRGIPTVSSEGRRYQQLSEGLTPLTTTPQPTEVHQQTTSNHNHSHSSDQDKTLQTSSSGEPKPPFLHSTSTSSSSDALLDRGTSSSDPQLSEHHHHANCESGDLSRRNRRRKRHTHHRREEAQRRRRSDPDHSPDEEGSPETTNDEDLVKEERETSQPAGCTQESSEQSEPVSSVASQRTPYPVNALVDVPMNAPLTRSSRTSSLSSSLSSFRFGGSLSQLWASQMSLSGKLPNMKSTGNINAETATMPSLGNQYFAFGGSLPELSLTSLSRLLPNSAANDPNMSSCPGLFTLLHPPLYVYPSQQHLTTPFINANGSITFGSFLSGGSSLCSAQKATLNTEAAGSKSNNDQGPSTAPAASTIITGSENKVVEGDYNKLHGSNSSLSSHDGIKVPMYTPVPAGSLIGHPQVITALPAFHTLTSSVASLSSSISSPIPSSTTTQMCHTVASSPPNVAAPNLDTLACVATAPHHQLTNPVSPHTTPQHHMLHTSTTPHTHMQPHHHMHIDSKEGIVRGHYLAVNRPGVIQSSIPVSTHLPMSGIKMEADPCVVPSPVKLSQGSPHTIPVISMPMTECLSGESLPPHTLTASPAHHPHSSGLETSPKREKDRPYKCDHPGCGRSFSFPAHLRSHVQQIHISYRPCKCDFPSCGKRFYTPQHLNVHRRVHTGERPFVCPYTECSKAFTTAGNLKNHIRTHTGERPYSCKFDGCTKCFAEMSSLKKHELTHTGEKPYKCRVCGKAFSQAGSRNTHERKHSRTEDDGDGEMGSGKGPRRFRIKRISSGVVDSPVIKAEPMV